MKSTINTAAVMACVGILLGGALLQTGCSSTATHRSTGQTIDDDSITARVKTDLLKDPLIHSSDINVSAYQGNVQLNGSVMDQQQRQEAEQIARGVSGVASVQNNLQIKPEAAGAAPVPAPAPNQ